MTFQYQVLANQLAHRIYQDELKPHQKLISLRDFARQQGISLSTAKSCYELLEARGLIYVKPKSGYFVVARTPSSPIPDSPDFYLCLDMSQIWSCITKFRKLLYKVILYLWDRFS